MKKIGGQWIFGGASDFSNVLAPWASGSRSLMLRAGDSWEGENNTYTGKVTNGGDSWEGENNTYTSKVTNGGDSWEGENNTYTGKVTNGGDSWEGENIPTQVK